MIEYFEEKDYFKVFSENIIKKFDGYRVGNNFTNFKYFSLDQGILKPVL